MLHENASYQVSLKSNWWKHWNFKNERTIHHYLNNLTYQFHTGEVRIKKKKLNKNLNKDTQA